MESFLCLSCSSSICGAYVLGALLMLSKPRMCRKKGCYYFGAGFFDGYCSVCYRLHQETEPETQPKTEPETEPKTEPETEPKPSGESGTKRSPDDFVPEGAGPYYSSSAGTFRSASLRQDLPFVGTMASSSGDASVPRFISHRTHPTDVSHLEAGDWWVSIEPSRLPEHDLDWRCLVCDKVAHRLHVESKMHRKRLSVCQPQWDLSVSLTRGLGAECRRAWLGRIKSQIDSQKDHCGMLEQNKCLGQLRLRLQGQGFWLPPPPGLELVEVLSE